MRLNLLKYATLKNTTQNLLPRVIFERIVLNHKLPKIKLGLPRRVLWLSIIFFIIFTLLGYYPTFGIPPVKKASVLANAQEQKGEIIADAFPQPVILPHPGYLSTRFSSFHPGIDIAAGLGMPIHPITAGVVEEAGTDFFGLGKYVVISHQKGYQSKYAHLGKIYVKAGQDVTTESILGEVGLTGHTSGPHTHLEVTLNGKYTDPQTILPEIPDMPRVAATK